MKLDVHSLSFHYNSHAVLQEISLHSGPMLTAIIGPNAAGKSTLLKCLAGMLHPQGAIMINDTPTSQFKKTELTALLSYLPQQSGNQAALTVLEAVLLGRLSALTWRVSEQDLTLALSFLEELGIDDLASHPLNELSGGQQQMVSIAQALVREPKILLMDEPTNNLDLHHQLELFDMIRDITILRQLTTIMALHDLNHAARYADRIIVLHQGQIYDAGSPADVLTAEMIRNVYRVCARVTHDENGVPFIFPMYSVSRKHLTSQKLQQNEKTWEVRRNSAFW